MAPARDTTADVIMPFPGSGASFLRSDHRQNAPIAATRLATITGTNSRRSLPEGILSNSSSIPRHLFAGIGFETVNEARPEAALGKLAKLSEPAQVPHKRRAVAGANTSASGSASPLNSGYKLLCARSGCDWID
jgi:hypothetical protein